MLNIRFVPSSAALKKLGVEWIKEQPEYTYWKDWFTPENTYIPKAVHCAAADLWTVMHALTKFALDHHLITTDWKLTFKISTDGAPVHTVSCAGAPPMLKISMLRTKTEIESRRFGMKKKDR